MNTVRWLSFGTLHLGSHIVLNDDVKTWDTSTMYRLPSSSATDEKLNPTLSMPNSITRSLQFDIIKIVLYKIQMNSTCFPCWWHFICFYFIVVIIVGLGQSDPYCPHVNRQTSKDSFSASNSFLSCWNSLIMHLLFTHL